MTIFRSLILWATGLFISAIFIDSLRFKFTGHPTPEHIFTTLRDWSGIGLFYPAGPWIIGLGELLAAILLVAVPLIALIARLNPSLSDVSRFIGGLVALGIMTGAIGFHLFTPLGIPTPTEWDASGTEILETSSALFIAACITWVCAVVTILLTASGARRALAG